jgi:hypothetical protein
MQLTHADKKPTVIKDYCITETQVDNSKSDLIRSESMNFGACSLGGSHGGKSLNASSRQRINSLDANWFDG